MLVEAADNLDWPFNHVERLGLAPKVYTQRALARHDVLGLTVPFEPDVPAQDIEID